jgi:hypothetical protein
VLRKELEVSDSLKREAMVPGRLEHEAMMLRPRGRWELEPTSKYPGFVYVTSSVAASMLVSVAIGVTTSRTSWFYLGAIMFHAILLAWRLGRSWEARR